jgi:transcriptional regulator with XRE-family HTH domain
MDVEELRVNNANADHSRNDGARLCAIRVAAGISQSELAAALGYVGPSSISIAEAKPVHRPETIQRFEDGIAKLALQPREQRPRIQRPRLGTRSVSAAQLREARRRMAQVKRTAEQLATQMRRLVEIAG